jgi:hypothetical protein
MIVRHTAPAEIASTLRIERRELDRRVTGMLARLKLPGP